MHLRSPSLLPPLCLGIALLPVPLRPAQAGPMIDRIDPPDWFEGLPSPMLLVHGSGLRGAHLSVTGRHLRLLRVESSPNGHWAFLWLDTGDAPAQALSIVAACGREQARASFRLKPSRRRPGGQAGFGPEDVLYLIMPDRFADGLRDPAGDDRAAPRGWHGGDLYGIESRLDYLQGLGVTTLWTTPVASNGSMPDSYHGYAATDLYDVDAHLGTIRDYRRLSDALHARGMKLVIDLVPNHVGVRHPWVDDPPAEGWFHGSRRDHLSVGHDLYRLIDPHAAPGSARAITSGWFTDGMPDLNQENPLVSRYLIQNALWWVETADLDGIRLDTLPYVGRAFWHDLHAALHARYPRLTTVGEVFHRDPEVTSFFAGGRQEEGIDTGLDTLFDFPLHFALRDVLAHGAPMTEVDRVLRRDALYPHPERLVTFFGNHDTTRFLTEAGGSVPGLKLAVGLILTLRGVPQIYSGDEIGMTGGADPDNRRDFPGGFPGDARSAFTVAGRTPVEQEILRWTEGLIRLRSAHRALRGGIEQNLFADADGLAFVRAGGSAGCSKPVVGERYLIVVNRSTAPRSIDLPEEETALSGCTRYDPSAEAPGPRPVLEEGVLHLTEPAQTLSIYAVH